MINTFSMNPFLYAYQKVQYFKRQNELDLAGFGREFDRFI